MKKITLLLVALSMFATTALAETAKPGQKARENAKLYNEKIKEKAYSQQKKQLKPGSNFLFNFIGEAMPMLNDFGVDMAGIQFSALAENLKAGQIYVDGKKVLQMSADYVTQSKGIENFVAMREHGSIDHTLLFKKPGSYSVKWVYNVAGKPVTFDRQVEVSEIGFYTNLVSPATDSVDVQVDFDIFAMFNPLDLDQSTMTYANVYVNGYLYTGATINFTGAGWTVSVVLPRQLIQNMIQMDQNLASVKIEVGKYEATRNVDLYSPYPEDYPAQ